MSRKHRFTGRVWKFGDYIRGDSGILDFALIRDHSKPFNEKDLAANCFKNIRAEFADNVRKGDIVVAGKGFANYNHPQVSLAIKAAGIRCVLCESCEPSLVRKALNVGLPVLPVPGITRIVEDGEELEVDLEQGSIRNPKTGAALATSVLPERMLGIIEHGGVIEYLAYQKMIHGTLTRLDIGRRKAAE